MGMYTEFIFGCELSKDTPKVCVDALDYVINGKQEPPKYKNPEGYEQTQFNKNYIERTTPVEEIQKFIEEYDMYRLFCSCSYYFGAANPIHKFHYDNISDAYHISTRADLKNYEGQIEKFIDYIAPYVISGSGYVQYEEDEFPTLYGFEEYESRKLKVFKNPTFNDENPKLKELERIRKLNDVFNKLYTNLCPEYSISEEELKKHNYKLPLEDDNYKSPDYETMWDWMADYLIEKYGNNTGILIP